MPARKQPVPEDAVTARQTLLAGLARDGGLYVPERLTTLAPAAIRALSGLPYAEAATRLVAPFVGEDFAPDELSGLAVSYTHLMSCGLARSLACEMASV